MLQFHAVVSQAHKKSVRLRLSYIFYIEALAKPIAKRFRYSSPTLIAWNITASILQLLEILQGFNIQDEAQLLLCLPTMQSLSARAAALARCRRHYDGGGCFGTNCGAKLDKILIMAKFMAEKFPAEKKNLCGATLSYIAKNLSLCGKITTFAAE